MSDIEISGAVCPVPLIHDKKIVMGHGAGGKMSSDLIKNIFLRILDNPFLRAGDDSAVANIPNGNVAISTDSHVVFPLFFPGGDIGHLSVCGTVNDVAMMGAKPLYMSAGFILEEGFSIATLEKIVLSMKSAADEAGISIICGDTKVVERTKADGIYINTTGIGIIPAGININGRNAQVGDVIILSGTVGDHGLAVLGARGNLGFEADIQSDSAPLNHMISSMLAVSNNIHVLRDPTRGGLATTLNEIAQQSQVGMLIEESSIQVRPAVASVCEMLGFDPLYVANEGKLIAIVAPQDSEKVLKAIKQNKYGHDATIIGQVVREPVNRVLLKTNLGSTRVVDILMGEILPRIC